MADSWVSLAGMRLDCGLVVPHCSTKKANSGARALSGQKFSGPAFTIARVDRHGQGEEVSGCTKGQGVVKSLETLTPRPRPEKYSRVGKTQGGGVLKSRFCPGETAPISLRVYPRNG